MTPTAAELADVLAAQGALLKQILAIDLPTIYREMIIMRVQIEALRNDLANAEKNTP